MASLNKKVESVLNKQINAELWSGYMYLSMSAYMENLGLAGFAHWLKMQYHEENEHAMKLFDYIIERDGRVLLEPIEKVPHEWESIIEVFNEVYNHEKKVTKLINNCMDIAIEEKDYATTSMLRWFVDEQVGEEATSLGILDKLNIFEGKGQGLYMMNEELKAREK